MTPVLIRRIRRIAFRISIPMPLYIEHEDLAQEGLMAALSATSGYEVIAARRGMIDYMRRMNRERRHKPSPGDVDGAWWMVASLPAADGLVLAAETAARIEKALRRLPFRQRAVVEAIYLGEQKACEVAAERGTTDAAVSVSRKRALKAMRAGGGR